MRITGTTRSAAIAVVALLVAAGCGGGGSDGKPAAQAAPATTTHAGHGAQYSAPPAAPLRAGEQFTTVSMARPYTPKPPTGGGTDDYRCFLADPRLTQKTYVVGNQFLPQNADIVHHAIFFRVDPKDVPEARALDAKEPGDGWTCFGGSGITGAASRAAGGGTTPGGSAAFGGAGWLASWAPGGKENLASPGTATVLEPGTQIVMQVHYNLLATDGKASGSDLSQLRFRVAKPDPALQPLNTSLLVAPIELPCTPQEQGPLCDREASLLDTMKRFGNDSGTTVAGLGLLCHGGKVVAGTTQTCDRPARADITVRAMHGHMHLLGKSIKVEVNPGTPRAATLLDVPQYNFDDQAERVLATPVKVQQGDTLRVTCSHDASLRSKIPELRKLKPRYVMWGEGTSDEMCLGVMIYTTG